MSILNYQLEMCHAWSEEIKTDAGCDSDRQHEEDIRETAATTSLINQVIQEKDEEMAELKRQIAEKKDAKQRSASVAASSSGAALATAAVVDDSPRSNMSSPWGTDVRLLMHPCRDYHLDGLSEWPKHGNTPWRHNASVFGDMNCACVLAV